ncbi:MULTISPECIES: hypothetical protein [unclassified Ensifer]|uniref:gp53-like domain-containing protein n=1 Tax=unclassified Ensifer TaxID=2633371 RepID=UPI000813AA11|nr:MULTISPECIES: hypothetical protein [unclassified Ensifer]OCP04991.1 hypothetical protein BC362_14625 [Ensifer sp. LC14]OCP11850.1 hypothetical protein BC374_16380 [Ensifer sp. LC13]OCP12407.1 hypothetical protein BBX50_16580 [Ensifer sp. LC11]OCP33626.1 hypothetical protein BC364_15265 [Ensifer sp. LC499]
MTIPHTSGTITLTQNSAIIAGTDTNWQTAGVSGGIIYPEAPGGNPLPIWSIDSDTQAVAATKWKGASGTYPYALVKDTAYLKTVDAIHTKLLEVSLDLDRPSIAALAAIASQMAAGKVPRGLSANAMEWFTVTDAAKALLNLAGNAAADKLPYLSDVGAAALTGLTALARNLLNDPDQATMRGTIGAQAALGFTPVQQGGGVGQTGNKLYIGWNGTSALKATVDAFDLGRVWTDSAVLWNAASAGYYKFPNGFMLQWGYEPTGSGDFRKVFPVAFTTTCFAAVATMASSDLPTTTAVTVSTSNVDKFGFDIRARAVNSGGAVGGAGQGALWISVGY